MTEGVIKGDKMETVRKRGRDKVPRKKVKGIEEMLPGETGR